MPLSVIIVWKFVRFEAKLSQKFERKRYKKQITIWTKWKTITCVNNFYAYTVYKISFLASKWM